MIDARTTTPQSRSRFSPLADRPRRRSQQDRIRARFLPTRAHPRTGIRPTGTSRWMRSCIRVFDEELPPQRAIGQEAAQFGNRCPRWRSEKYDAELARRRAANGWRAFAGHAAGDAIAGIPGGIAHVIVLAGVDHRRGAALMEHRIRLAFVERDRRIEHLEFERAGRRDV